MKLRKKTACFRATATGTGNIIVLPEQDAPYPHALRKVTLFTPEDVEVAIAIDADPTDIAGARDYFWAWPPKSRAIDLHLQADQTVAAVVRTPAPGTGGAHFTIVVEYLTD